MRISDWSSDVCSSDLAADCPRAPMAVRRTATARSPTAGPVRRATARSVAEGEAARERGRAEEGSGRKVREARGGWGEASAIDRHAADAFLALDERYRKLVRELIAALAGVTKR